MKFIEVYRSGGRKICLIVIELCDFTANFVVDKGCDIMKAVDLNSKSYFEIIDYDPAPSHTGKVSNNGQKQQMKKDK